MKRHTGLVALALIATLLGGLAYAALPGSASPPPPPAPAADPSPPASGAPPVGAHLATQAETLEAIATVSRLAIESADRDAEHTKWVLDQTFKYLAVIGAVLTVVGFVSLKGVVINVRARALREVKKTTDGLNAQTAAIIAETQQSATWARDLILKTTEGVRNFLLAESFADVPADQRTYLKDAVAAILVVRQSAIALNDVKHQAWSYSFEALCQSRLGDFKAAIEAVRASRSLYTRVDPTLDYNLACYLCQDGQDAEALAALQVALNQDASGNLRAGLTGDGDFNDWRRKKLYPELVGTEIVTPAKRG